MDRSKSQTESVKRNYNSTGLVDPVTHAPIKKPRNQTNEQQLARLVDIFETETRTPSRERREEIAGEMNMTARSVQIWFQNRRQKTKTEYERQAEANLNLVSAIPPPQIVLKSELKQLVPAPANYVYKRPEVLNVRKGIRVKKAEKVRKPAFGANDPFLSLVQVMEADSPTLSERNLKALFAERSATAISFPLASPMCMSQEFIIVKLLAAFAMPVTPTADQATYHHYVNWTSPGSNNADELHLSPITTDIKLQILADSALNSPEAIFPSVDSMSAFLKFGDNTEPPSPDKSGPEDPNIPSAFHKSFLDSFAKMPSSPIKRSKSNQSTVQQEPIFR